MDASGGCGPAHDAGCGLVQVPAGGLFHAMMVPARRLLVVILTHMSGLRPVSECIRCVIYTRISKDQLGDGHGIANQLADLEKRARARGWTVLYQLSDNDIGVTRADATWRCGETTAILAREEGREERRPNHLTQRGVRSGCFGQGTGAMGWPLITGSSLAGPDFYRTSAHLSRRC